MDLYPPFIISARLLPAVRIGDMTISVRTGPRNHEGRTEYTMYFDRDSEEFARVEDIKSGCQGGDYKEGMSSLMSFLGAFAEAGEDGDNADLFPASMRPWVEAHSDEIACMGCDIDEPKET